MFPRPKMPPDQEIHGSRTRGRGPHWGPSAVPIAVVATIMALRDAWKRAIWLMPRFPAGSWALVVESSSAGGVFIYEPVLAFGAAEASEPMNATEFT